MFEILKTKSGKYYWILKSSNGMPIAQSFDVYTLKSSCKNGIESVRRNSYDAKILDHTIDKG